MTKSASLDNDHIQWVDFAKGITILLVICGHTIGNYYVRTLIFSFHMPLFFILSGYTYRRPENWKDYLSQIIKSSKRLLLPAYLIWIVRNVLYRFFNNIRYTPEQYILQGWYASGTNWQLKGILIPAFGMMWFLVPLFTVRTLYGLLSLTFKDIKLRILMASLLCFAGMYIGNKEYLPLTFDVSLVALLFFQFGTMLSKSENINQVRIACSIAS